jgi:Do/DeqQ family serine protease
MLGLGVILGLLLGGALELGPPIEASPAGGPVEVSARDMAAAAPLPSYADLAEKILPAVVSIQAQTIERGPSPRRRRGQPAPFDFFFGPEGPEGDRRDREYRNDAGGSGFVVSDDGLVVTNHHVIDGATKVRVHLGDRDYDAEIKGTDAATDLALLKIDAGRRLPYLKLGDSDKLRVGDHVIAVGSPLALQQTVTAGIVSAKGRAIGLTQDTSFENFIQTDAAINRGNSGGPLVNLRAEVVGIATAMNWGAENIGFAVPVNTLAAVLPQLRDQGKVSRGYLGINIQNLDWERAQAFGLEAAAGALVTSVVSGSPADRAGVEHGDVVVAVDGRSVKETRDLVDYVSARPPGSTVRLEVLRDGKRVEKQVELAERELPGRARESEGEGEGRGIDWLGLDYQELTPQLRENFGIGEREEGVVVREIAPSSPLYDEGVAPGDLIAEVNGRPVASGDEFERLVREAPPGSYLRFYVKRFDPRRGGESLGFFAVVRVP